VEVFLIDYGDSFFTTEMKTLPAQLAAVPPYATCCRLPLAVVPNGFGELQKGFVELQKKLQDKLFVESGVTMLILAVANEFLVVDFKTNNNESSTLIEKYLSDGGLHICTFFEGFVSKVSSLETISVRNSEWTEQLSEVEKALEEAASFPLLEHPRLGDNCVAKSEDGRFQRCWITALAGAKIKVCFYDCGLGAEVTEVRKMPEELVGVQISSQLVKMINVPESEASMDKLMKMFSDGTVKFEFLVMELSSFDLEVVIFKDGFDVRKLVSRNSTPAFDSQLANIAQKTGSFGEEMPSFGFCRVRDLVLIWP